MKILVVTQYYWPEGFKINDLVESLTSRGHEVAVLTGIPNYPVGRWFDGYGLGSAGKTRHGRHTIIRMPLIPRFAGRGWQLVLNYFSFALSASLLGPLLYRDKPDVIFVYEPSPFTVGIPAAVIRFLRKSPLIFWVQDLWPESLSATGAVHSRTILSMVGWMVKKIYQSCDHVLIQSRAFRRPAIDAGAPEDRMSYFPNWAEDYYQPLSPPVSNLDLPDGFKVMFAGNMGAAQSLETIINAAVQLKDKVDVYWIMIGDGRRKPWMMEEVKRLGLEKSVLFTGRKPATEMPQYFSNADALIATLAADEIISYTVPAKVQTYLACGRPLVVALNGEGANIVHESGSGYAVAAGDYQALAGAIEKMYFLGDEERQAMGHAALEYSRKNFDRQQLVERLEMLMKQVSEVGLCAS